MMLSVILIIQKNLSGNERVGHWQSEKENKKRKREEYSLVRDSRTSHTCTRRSMSPNSWNKEGGFWVAWFMVNISIMEALFGWTKSSSPLKTTQKSYCKIISKDKERKRDCKVFVLHHVACWHVFLVHLFVSF